MFCSECGSQIPDGVAACPNCGAAQPVQAAAPQPQPQPTFQATPAPEPQPQPYQQAPADQAQYAYQQAPADQAQYAYQQQAPADQAQYAYQQQAGYQQAPASSGFSVNQLTPPAFDFNFEAPTGINDVIVGYNKEGVAYAESTGLQMKWYKALTVWLLYLSALGDLITAFQYFTGNVYGGSGIAKLTYAIFPALHIVDIVYGLFVLALVAVILYVRMRLAMFKKDAPALFLYMLLISLGGSLVYSLLTLIITGTAGIIGTLLITLIVCGVMYYLNKVYFDKRQHLFTM